MRTRVERLEEMSVQAWLRRSGPGGVGVARRRVVSWARSQGVTVMQWVLTEWNPLKVPNTQKMPPELRKLGESRRGPELTRPFRPQVDRLAT